ncbi:MAG: ribosomal L7Ae/L30e/S12e/Gadd45 family protein [Clostridium sp.]|uniref:ribosomal L7Ae/L30e/S12e/Gadd45 family protein n=1 Tax=Clostridium sp. DSM 8431 TaxID=1761781 RepID=UPI0008E3DCEC|nr:ribosomal L7Ae/L30e/S12e/Gadd45 family protein [Clostridium sp. DSM 8431]MCR4943102.1 ribosomal L7Ae/L30e/S12e/Gadd45 family protein [Clostridium sp.]SFU63979.1 large subunit ribosomal protein L7A [Clostridium sp. DSM 8431]
MLERIVDKKVIGIKQCTKLLKNDEGRVLYVAKDVDKKLIAPLIELANEKKVDIKFVETMKELGKLCGIEVESSAALVL